MTPLPQSPLDTGARPDQIRRGLLEDVDSLDVDAVIAQSKAYETN